MRENADQIFLIISDMNMPTMNGMDFKKGIDNDGILREKSIPFIFATSAPIKSEVTQAFAYRVQGFFRKPNAIEEQADMLDIIIKYWIISSHPNTEVNMDANTRSISKRTTT